MAWRHVTASGWAVAGAAALAVGTTGVWPVAAAEARTPDAAPSAPAEGDSLKQVQVVFRHGARTPLGKRYWPQLVDAWDVCGTLYEPVAVDITTDEGEPRPINAHDAEQVATVFKGGCARGELTREGQQQARSYGRWLRRRYVGELGLLPERQEEGVLVGRTTNYSRTVATLRGVLTGLYPDADRPFPVTTTEELDEILFGNAESCQRLKRLVAETASATRVEAAAPPPDVRALQKRVRGALGLPPTEVVHFLDLHDAVTTMRAHGKPIPEGLQDYELLRAVEFQATKHFLSFVAPSAEPDVLRLGMGRLLALLVARMDAAAAAPEGSAQPRLYMYSGHDSTIMPLLVALGTKVEEWPPYLSNLVFELWERPQGGEPYVRVLYNKEELPLTELCGAPQCSLKQLRETVLRPYLLSKDQRDSECLLHFVHDAVAGEHVRQVASGSSVVGGD